MQDFGSMHYPFTLTPLPYEYDALLPHLIAEILEVHHDKHLKTYVDNLNKALEACPKYHKTSLERLLINVDELPAELQTSVRNNGGGVYNHELYFNCMTGNQGTNPSNELAAALLRDIGPDTEFMKQMTDKALTQFGSGYAWLVSYKGQLKVLNTANQDTPLSKNIIPLIALDVWEHAYYLQYLNRRAEYIENWFPLINWDYVSKRYEDSIC